MGREGSSKGKKSKEDDKDHNKRSTASSIRGTGSTTSLGKRRSLNRKRMQSPRGPTDGGGQQQQQQQQATTGNPPAGSSTSSTSTLSTSRAAAEYGSQSSPMRIPTSPKELTKVAILGAAGGIGQPLSMLMMLHSEYVQHLALYDLSANIHGVGLDISHIDRACKVTTHLGQEELADAVRDAKVIIIPAGLAQKPGMSRDDLFGSNAKIMFNLATVCAQVAPKAMLAIISNPVNSLVPLTCEVYHKMIHGATTCERQPGQSPNEATSSPAQQANGLHQQQTNNQKSQPEGQQRTEKTKSFGKSGFDDCFRRIFGVTTLDVIRASTLSAKSALLKPETNGLFKDPSKLTIPVVGGHAGKTIMPMLSMATPKFDKKRLAEDKATTSTIVDSIQRAGIDVLNAKKGTGSATLSMAYAACRFTISLLRAQQGEQNIIECAYVRHKQPLVNDLEYFSVPLVLGKDGYTKALPLNQSKLLPFEQQMIEEGCKELRTSIAKGEDFARENLYKER